jgi:vancomycin resistance protein YoaR
VEVPAVAVVADELGECGRFGEHLVDQMDGLLLGGGQEIAQTRAQATYVLQLLHGAVQSAAVTEVGVEDREVVDGALIRPGEVFSLNEHTGERSYAQGFQEAAVIIDGRLQPGVGGGISQFTTTLFNAAYYAGLEDVEHRPHTIHYTRYPPVIEATIFYPHLDLKFRNDTAYGVLIDTSYTDDSVTVTLWSTKVWDEVTTEWSPKRDTTRPQRRYVTPGPSCIETQGIDGFTQDAWRVFHRDGGEVKREKFTWRYDPQPEVVCGEEPDDD